MTRRGRAQGPGPIKLRRSLPARRHKRRRRFIISGQQLSVGSLLRPARDLLTSEQVDRLLHDPSRDVRAWVAGAAPLTPEQMDEVAQHDRSVDVLDMLIHRKDVSAQNLRRIAAHTNAELAFTARHLLEEQNR
jgi:hypothetical protein